MLQLKSLAIASLVAAVSAHQNLHQFWVNEVSPGFEIGIRRAPSNSPVTDLTSNDIVCNVGGTSGANVQTIEAKAGDKITVQWDQSGHPGPITHMLHGPVASAGSATGVGEWFKIDELNNVDGKWANEIMSANSMKHTFTIPAGVTTGEYLLRSEMLALHGAQTVGGAQFYIGCMQLKITGSSTSNTCGPKITLPGAYKAEDANIYIPNVYNGFDVSSYKAPGGPVASCGAGSGGNSPAPAPVPVPSAPVSSSVPVSSTAPSTTAAPSETVAPTPVATSSPTSPAEGEYPEETSAPVPSPTEPAEEYPVPSATQPAEETSAPTPEPTQPSETEPTQPSEPEPSTPSPAPAPATELPADTKLSSVLAWVSRFYAAHGSEFDGETPLRRRHARQF